VKTDISILNGRIFNPSIGAVAPISPLFVRGDYPLTLVFLLLPLLDYGGTPTRVLRAAVDGFQRRYLMLFTFCLIARLIFFSLSMEMTVLQVGMILVFLVAWGWYYMREWNRIYSKAQES
jgi:hypothetical protein